MKKIKFYIKPRLYLVDQELWTLSDEIHLMNIDQIQDGIDSCQFAIQGTHQEMSWGLEVFELIIQKETSKLYYNSLFIRDVSTLEFQDMLVKYKNALLDWEEKILRYSKSIANYKQRRWKV